MPQVEIYTPAGVVSGSTARATVASDAKGAAVPVRVDASRWYPLDGTPAERHESVTVPADEILLIVLDSETKRPEGSWYPIEMELGPYHLAARQPVAPGFDPARALARPSGAYMTLRDVSISLPGRPEAQIAHRATAHVNRYAVERVASNLMLAFFFPGAEFEPLREALAGPPITMAAGSAQPA